MFKSGVTPTIVVAKTPTLAASFAAKELAEHFEKAMGTRPHIRNDSEVIEGPLISIGDTSYARKVGLLQETVAPQEYIIDITPGLVILYGKDQPEAKGEFPGFFEERGSLDATYEFLERYCGVRWYRPGELGRVIPRFSELSLPVGRLQKTPDMKYLWLAEAINGYFIPSRNDPVNPRDVTFWMLRMRLGGEKYEANHSFLGYYDRFLDSHPEYFGKESIERPNQLCYSEPGLINQVIADADAYFSGAPLAKSAKGMGRFFGLVPMDNVAWCPCEKCQVELRKHKPTRDDVFFSNGKASEYFWGFANKVAAGVQEKHPDKYIAALAYMDWAAPPIQLKLEENISVQLCLNIRTRRHPLDEAAEQRYFDQWAEISKDRPFYLWLYFCFPAMSAHQSKFDPFPGYSARHVIEWMKRFHAGNVRGIFLEHSSEFFESHLLDVPDLYLIFRLARDKTLDGTALLNDFFKGYYGNAAAPMSALYSGIEDTYWDAENYKNTGVGLVQPGVTEEIAWGRLGTSDRMAKWRELINQASNLALNRSDKARLNDFIKGVWLPMENSLEKHPELARYRSQPIQEINVPRIPDVAGDIAKVNWSKAYLSETFRQMSGAPALTKVRLMLAHDREFLYIRFSDETKGAALHNSVDWWGDTVEIFVAKSRDAFSRQLAVIPDGSIIAERVYDGGSGVWKSGAVIRSQYADDQPWVVDVALPLKNLLGEDANLDQPFYLNAYRATKGQKELLGLSPNFAASFHDLERMAKITLKK